MKAKEIRKPSYWDKLTPEEKNEWRELYGLPLEPTAAPSPSEPTEPEREPASEQSNSLLSIVLGVMLAFVGLLVLIVALGQGPSRSSNSTPSRVGKREAYSAMQEFVNDRLKAPSTAKYESAWDIVVYGSGDVYSSTFWVDAQNSFGAHLRHDCSVSLRRDGDRWILLSLSIE